MALDIFTQTLKDKSVGTIAAAILVFLYIFWLATFYPMMESNMATYDEMLKNPTIKAFLGDEIVSLSTFSGYMTVEVFSYMGLVVGAFIIFMTASFLAGEIEQKSSELLLSLPVSRVSVTLSRFAVLLPVIAILMLAELMAIYLGGVYIGEDSQIKWFAFAMLFMGVFTLAVGAGALLVSAIMSEGRNAALLSVGILLAMFLVENIGTMVTSIDWARKLSFFHYAKVGSIVTTQSVDWTNMAILLAVAIVFLVLAVLAFRQRDINVT